MLVSSGLEVEKPHYCHYYLNSGLRNDDKINYSNHCLFCTDTVCLSKIADDRLIFEMLWLNSCLMAVDHLQEGCTVSVNVTKMQI